jgi:NodT family efflux transporter outer membrane factor (OMF) lipoprotein
MSLLLITACKVGPDYRAPTPDSPSAWKEHDPAKTPAASLNKTRWWTDFNDEALNQLVGRALNGNENLKTAAARIVEVRGLRESAAGALYPEINGGASASRTQPGAATTRSDLTIYQAEFDAAWEIDLFGGTRRQVEAENALAGSVEAAYRDAALSLVAEVAREYIMLRQLQAQMVVTHQTADIQRQLYDIAQDHYKGGLVSTLDVSQSEALYKTTLARIPDFERQIAASSYRISVLLGEKPGTVADIVARPRPIPKVHALPVLDAPADILRQRPDIAVAERNLAAATALQGVAASALYPKISLSALFGVQHGVLPLFDYLATHNVWGAGAGLTMPIFEFGTIEGQIKAADAKQVQAFHQYRQAVLAALGDVETDLSNLARESRRYQILQDASKSADHAVSIGRERYRSGLSDFTTVLQTEQQRFSLQLDVIASQSAIAQDVIALHKAVGDNPASVPASN